MELFGWMVLAAGLALCSLFSFAFTLYTLRRYSIGGAPHTVSARLISWALLVGCYWLWTKLIPLAPFSFSLT